MPGYQNMFLVLAGERPSSKYQGPVPLIESRGPYVKRARRPARATVVWYVFDCWLAIAVDIGTAVSEL